MLAALCFLISEEPLDQVEKGESKPSSGSDHFGLPKALLQDIRVERLVPVNRLERLQVVRVTAGELHHRQIVPFRNEHRQSRNPGYRPVKINTTSIVSVTPCAMMGTARFRPHAR